ncbi:MAG: hypothetical protein RMJ55_04380 [Roseiflexaceae bacterium]|nr:hypothetical protein [Roseiflexaceae bacterium]
MPRWYKGFRCGGIKPQNLVDRIAKYVQQYDIGHLVPVVRVEKRAGRGDYYVFLAIESPVIGQIPEPVQPMLRQPNLLGQALDQPFTFADIRRMVGAEHSVHDYVRLIPYIRPAPLSASDPFEEGDTAAEEAVTSDEIAARTRQYDRLLAWLSATGSGSWQAFQQTWQKILGGKDTPSQALRRLRLLGHIETSADRKRWAVAPSVVFPITSGERAGQWVLCGRRDARLLEHFRQKVNIEFVPQDRGDGPATVYLHARDPKHMATICEPIERLVYQDKQAGLMLARLLPPLDRWKESLESLQGIRPHAYWVKAFNGTTFTEVSFSGKSGLYELWSLDNHAAGRADLRPEYTLYYDEVRQQWLRADWYGLRFLARYEAGQSCPVQYSSTTHRLAAPFDWRWPEIYERALVLASGRLPSYQSGWLIYESISAELVDELRDKLRLNDEESNHA